jgi:FAD/FMN-containing dehydrogenase/Fe-S oxidoreductase
MAGELRRRISAATQCEIRWDNLSRQLYATDASIYQVEPQAVALPKSAAEAAECMAALGAEGIGMTPRGAGTGLAGGALGRGVVLDLARYNKAITDLNVDARTCRVGAGVVLDQLNAFLAPHGLMFGPDVATSSRATLGGMINNNSSGSRTPRYGTTIDHVRSVEMVLADGRVVILDAHGAGLNGQAAAIAQWIQSQDATIRARFHEGIIKRWPGYAIDKFLRTGGNFATLAGGSEGTLGALWSAELQLMPLPRRKGLGLLFFETVIDAMEATVDLFDLQPDAIEHIDDVLFNETRGQLQFQAARDFLELDDKPCKSILIVEFTDDIDDRLDALMRKPVGIRKKLCNDAVSQGYVLELRKSGLSLLTSRKGDAKPTAGIEDVAVPPAKLPDYVRGLQSIMQPMGIDASFYGHAASGLLHVRPIVDLHDAEGIRRFRQIAEGVSALTLQFKGSLAAEHGVGMARTEFMAEHIGPDLLDLMARIKGVFDPRSLMNPGKIFSNGDIAIDRHLRQGAGSKIPDSALPFEVRLGYVTKDESFVGHLEQCNGNGACKKSPPVMCPTFVVTGEEIQSTRGRANTIRAVIEGRVGGDDPLGSPELTEALKYCLSCKACKRECPSNVDMALMKAELLHARHKRHGAPLASKVVSRPDLLGAMASWAPGLANASMRSPLFRRILERSARITSNRPLPSYAAKPFSHTGKRGGARGTVTLWDDCFCRYNEPGIGHAAVKVLEAMGYTVELPENRACCGRPAFSNGLLDTAAEMGRKNTEVLGQSSGPIVFLEPSCYSMFAQDYLELGIPGAQDLKRRAVLLEDFLLTQLDALEPRLRADAQPVRVGIHVHCHAKALTNQANAAALAKALPGHDVTLLNTGCCGMAGAYGMMNDTYDLSLKVAEPLVRLVGELPADAKIVASGTSCRHQLEALTPRQPIHMAQLIADALR